MYNFLYETPQLEKFHVSVDIFRHFLYCINSFLFFFFAIMYSNFRVSIILAFSKETDGFKLYARQ